MQESVGQLSLWPGSALPWQVRESRRARRLSVRVFHDGAVEVVVPPRTAAGRVADFMVRHREWIERQQRRIPKHLDVPFPPQSLELAGIGEHWRLRCQPARQALRVEVQAGGELLAIGTAADAAAFSAVLRRWLVERARERLSLALAARAERLGARYTRLQIRLQRSRWGSCSARGTISLNACLLFQRPEVLDYLLVHELSHRKHMNHSAAFWAEVERHCAAWRSLDRELVGGWRRVPGWVLYTPAGLGQGSCA